MQNKNSQTTASAEKLTKGRSLPGNSYTNTQLRHTPEEPVVHIITQVLLECNQFHAPPMLPQTKLLFAVLQHPLLMLGVIRMHTNTWLMVQCHNSIWKKKNRPGICWEMWCVHCRDGGIGKEGRGKEGTYRNKFPVPACRTLSEKRRP